MKKGEEKNLGFFGSKQRAQQRRYKEVLQHYPRVVTVKASGSKKEVHERIVRCIDKMFPF